MIKCCGKVQSMQGFCLSELYSEEKELQIRVWLMGPNQTSVMEDGW